MKREFEKELNGIVVQTITLEEYRRQRDREPVHVVRRDGENGADAA